MIEFIIWLYGICIVISAIMSWLPFLRDSVIGRMLNRIVDPYLNFFRKGPIKRLAYSTGIDVSAVIGLLILYIIQDYVLPWLPWILKYIFRLIK